MEAFDCIGLAVHPRRQLENALATVREWAERQGAEIVQVAGKDREVAPAGEVRSMRVSSLGHRPFRRF